MIRSSWHPAASSGWREPTLAIPDLTWKAGYADSACGISQDGHGTH